MKMLNNLFASLLFAVLTFTATAQVTHNITVGSGTVNVTVAEGDILHFTPGAGVINMLVVWTPTMTSLSVYDYTVAITDTAYYGTNTLGGSTYGKITVVTSTLTTGIESIKHTTTKLSVFPNPSTDEVSVTFNTNKEKTTIEVFDIEGRLVMIDETTREIGQNTVKINVSNFSRGLYYAKVRNESVKITRE